MTGGALSRLRQVLWVGAGVALLSLLVVAGSWLFSPRPDAGKPDGAPFQMPAQSVQRDSFRSEGSSGQAQRFTPEPGARAVPSATSRPPASKTTVEPLDGEPSRAASTQAANTVPPPPTPAPPPVKAPATKPEPPKAPATAPLPLPTSRGAYGVQVGAFSSLPNTEAAKKKLESMGYTVALVRFGDATKVIARGFSDRASAEKALEAIRAGGYAGAFVLPLE
jgi:cell division septation protein DedD